MKESFRYNCLHVAAKENRPHFAEFVLNLLSNTTYLRSLYRNDSMEQAKARSMHILDLYLNTPEKGVGLFLILLRFRALPLSLWFF